MTSNLQKYKYPSYGKRVEYVRYQAQGMILPVVSHEQTQWSQHRAKRERTSQI